MQNKIQIFEKYPIRAIWDEENEKWWFSIIDITSVLTNQPDYQKAKNYWKWLKNRLKEEGSELVSNTNQLKMQATDGKKYLTDVADTEQVLRLVQSIPSRKAEPFKLWLAKVGNERINETLSIERQPANFDESAIVAAEGATAAKVAREQIEKSTGKSAISSLNAKSGMMIGKHE